MSLTRAVGYYSSRYEPGVVFPDTVSVDRKQLLDALDNLSISFTTELDRQQTQQATHEFSISSSMDQTVNTSDLVVYTGSIIGSVEVSTEVPNNTAIAPELASLLYSERFEAQEAIQPTSVAVLDLTDTVQSSVRHAEQVSVLYETDLIVAENVTAANPGELWLYAPNDSNHVILNSNDIMGHAPPLPTSRTEAPPVDGTPVTLESGVENITTPVARTHARIFEAEGTINLNTISQTESNPEVIRIVNDLVIDYNL